MIKSAPDKTATLTLSVNRPLEVIVWRKHVRLNDESVTVSNDDSVCDGIFPLPDSDSDSKPDGYIVLCITFSTGSDSDLDPYTEFPKWLLYPF